jgi:galactose mutarotase-like enzyme
MVHTLQNEHLKFGISSLGAELCSIKTVEDDLEFIWHASPHIWPRHAPILFPIVGKLKNNTFKFKNKQYTLSQHGFARDKEFELINQENKRISYKLKADPETLRIFPFNFELTVIYILEDKLLHIVYEVLNYEQESLYFSIGAHPGFRCPLLHNEDFEDYFLEFEQKETLIKHKIQNGMISEEQEVILEAEKILPLKKQLFKDDALVFKSFRSKFLIIKNHKNPHQIKAGLEGFPYLGIWTKPAVEASFICIEPWLGITDSINADGDLAIKEGIIKLNKGENFSCSYTIEVK